MDIVNILTDECRLKNALITRVINAKHGICRYDATCKVFTPKIMEIYLFHAILPNYPVDKAVEQIIGRSREMGADLECLGCFRQ